MKLLKAHCPVCNENACAIVETLSGRALLMGSEIDGTQQYAGETLVDWDSQRAVTDAKGECLVECSQRHQWRTKIEDGDEYVPSPKPHIVIHLEGGLVHDVLSAEPLTYTTLDYDVDGCLPCGIFNVPQGDGEALEGHINTMPASLTTPERIAAIAQSTPVQAECSECKADVTPDDNYFATPCGSYCDACMVKHLEGCEICRKEFKD